jgi:branched-chain amino acid transport system substrate-binding protein
MRVRLLAVPMAIAGLIAVAELFAPTSAVADDVFKVGFMAPLSGPFAALGDSIDRGARLYEKVHGNNLSPGVTI